MDSGVGSEGDGVGGEVGEVARCIIIVERLEGDVGARTCRLGGVALERQEKRLDAKIAAVCGSHPDEFMVGGYNRGSPSHSVDFRDGHAIADETWHT